MDNRSVERALQANYPNLGQYGHHTGIINEALQGNAGDVSDLDIEFNIDQLAEFISQTENNGGCHPSFDDVPVSAALGYSNHNPGLLHNGAHHPGASPHNGGHHHPGAASPQRMPQQPPYPGQPQQQQQPNGIMGQHLKNFHPLPESPPDSSSEPYSPQENQNQQQQQQQQQQQSQQQQAHDQTSINNYNVKGSMMQPPHHPGHHPGAYLSAPHPAHQHQQQQQQPHGPPPPSSSVSPPHPQQSPPSATQTQHQHQHSQHTQHQQNPPGGQKPPGQGGGVHYGGGGGGYPEPPKLNHGPSPPHMHSLPLNVQMLPAQFNDMNNLTANHANKKRKYGDSPGSNNLTPGGNINPMHPGLLNIKPEPGKLPLGMLNECDDSMDYFSEYGADIGGSFIDPPYQVIKWRNHLQEQWASLLDDSYKPLPSMGYRVDADKGFNFSTQDDSFVCQKKNHFQVTVHCELHGHPKYVKTPEGAIKPIETYYLHFHGVKMESMSQVIRIEQSQSDRSKRPFHPVRIDLHNEPVHKLTVGRMHFSETTSNNMRKKGKPNPDQRYFMLVVELRVHSGEDQILLAAQVSERIIVRASNPGQFDNDVEVAWMKGNNPDAVYHMGPVGVNTDRPDQALTVHGNIKLTGHVIQPSDRRAKTDFRQLDTRDNLSNIKALNLYSYRYRDSFAEYVGMSDDEKMDTGILAQEVKKIIPEAVRDSGDIVLNSGKKIENFQVVNKDRIFMESVGAVKELCKVTEKMENKISELEHLHKKYGRTPCKTDSIKSSCSTMSLSTCSTVSHASSRNSNMPYKIPTSPADFSTSTEKEKNAKNKDSSNNNKDSSHQDNNNKSSSQQHNHKDDKHHRHHHHHHHRHHCRHRSRGGQDSTPPQASEAEGMCSSRFVQITIIILVLVMAFCLVSITTLYVLERKDSKSPSVVLNPNPNETALINPGGGPVPLTPPRCLRPESPCVVVCCPSHTVLDDPGDYPHSGETDNPGMEEMAPGKAIKPADPDQSENTLDKSRGGTKGPYEYDSRGNPVMIDGVYSLPDKTPVNKTPKRIPTPVVMDGFPHVTVEQQNDLIAYRRKRAILSSKLVPVVIKQINRTLDSDYCANSGCRSGTGGKYVYYVPLSHVFPLAMITMQFVLPEMAKVTLCQQPTSDYYEHNTCPTPNGVGLGVVQAIEGGPNEWNLPVGYYTVLTTYRLRVADKVLTDVCNLEAHELGLTYTEYILKFKRVSSDTCEDRANTNEPIN